MAAEYKCDVCGYIAKTKKEMNSHIQKEHAKQTKQEIKGHSVWGFIGGLISGYILVYALTYLLGYLIAGAIIGVFFIWILNLGRDRNDKTLQWFGIGGLGLLLGILIDFVIRSATNKTNAYKYAASIIGWIIILAVFILIYLVFSSQ